MGLRTLDNFDMLKNLVGSIAVLTNASIYLPIYQGAL